MNVASSDGSAYNEDLQEPHGGSIEFSAPLAGLKPGRLVVTSQIQGIRLRADLGLPYLYRAHIPGSMPGIRVQENTVTLDPGSIPHHPANQSNRSLGELRLNGAIPWEIEFRQEVAHLEADLRQLDLLSLDVLGSASHIRLALPKPLGSLYLYISGGTNHSTIHLHPDAEVKIHIGVGGKDLVIDQQRYEVLEGETNLASPGFSGAVNKYEFCLAGGVNGVTIQSRIGENEPD